MSGSRHREGRSNHWEPDSGVRCQKRRPVIGHGGLRQTLKDPMNTLARRNNGTSTRPPPRRAEGPREAVSSRRRDDLGVYLAAGSIVV